MKKLFIFLSLLSSVSFVGLEKKPTGTTETTVFSSTGDRLEREVGEYLATHPGSRVIGRQPIITGYRVTFESKGD